MPISCRCITGRSGVGVARPAQQVGEGVHKLTQDERGELQDHVEGVRGGSRVRGGNSDKVLMAVLVLGLGVIINHIGIDEASRPTSQGAGCLTAPSLPHHRPPRPPGPVIGTINIRGGRGYGLAHAIWTVEHGSFDIMETIQTDVCYNNRQGYGMRGAAARPTCAGVSQDGVGLGSQDPPNGWGLSPRAYTG